MSVCVVADEAAIVEPDDASGTEIVFQSLLNLLLSERLVAMRRQQTHAGCEYGPITVALDRAALQHEIQMVLVFSRNPATVVKTAVDGIVFVCLKLIAPSVETEIEQFCGSRFRHFVSCWRVVLIHTISITLYLQCDEPVIACPCIVCRTLMKHNIGHRCSRQFILQQLPYFCHTGRDDDKLLMVGYLAGHLHICGSDVCKHRCPVGSGMWPR